MKYNECISMLTPLHGKGEATAIVRTVMEERFGLSLSDLLLCKDTALSANEHHDLEKIMQELLSGTPVQYVLGSARFCGKPFYVTPDVLIPRPETEQLVTLVPRGGVVADLGTGSGCIAVSVALDRDPKQVIAIDVSEKAIEVAKKNAKTHAADVDFILQDMLDIEATYNSLPQLDCIVSNPPFFDNSLKAPDCRRCAARHTGLSYREILQFSETHLSPGGRVSMILPSQVEADLLRYGRMCGLVPWKLLRIRTVETKDPSRLIVQFARKGALCHAPGELTLTDGKGRRTSQHASLLTDYLL